MKKTTITFGLFIFLFSISQTFAQSSGGTNLTDKQGKKQGKWIMYNNHNTKFSEGTYKDGYRDGDFTYYFPNGNTKAIVHYLNKGKDATYKSFDENGTVIVEGFYKNEKRDSLWNFYNPSGEKIAVEHYKLGKKDGINAGYKNGKLQESIEWKNDEKDGKWYRERIMGGYLVGYYKNGKLDGKYEEFSESGTALVKGQYLDNNQTGEWQYFDEKGQLEKVEHWKDGQLLKNQVILRTLQQTNIILPADSIAYFYNKGRIMCVKTLSGETLQVQNKAEHFIEVVGETSFLVVNYEMKFYANYNAVKSIQLNPENDKWQVILSPASDFEVFADKEAAKGLRIYFGQDE